MVLTCVFERPHVFELFLLHFPNNQQLCVVGQKTDPCYELLLKMRPESFWVDSDNKPLGKKFNNGLKALKAFKWDYLTILGSDDVLTPGLWDYIEQKKGQYHYIGLLDYYFTDLERVRYFSGHQANRKGEPI